MKKIFGYYISRIIVNGILLLIQIVLIIGCCGYFCIHFKWLHILFFLFAVFTSFKIATQKCNLPCRIGWIIGVLSVPILFLPMYYIYGSGRILKRINKYIKNNPINLMQCNNISSAIPNHISKQFLGLSKVSNLPFYTNSDCQYFSSGESFFEQMKNDMLKAEKYIFLEFFIINNGLMWKETLDILKSKAKQGVEIYILYDDMGTIALLPKDFKIQMKNLNINARNFNAFSGILTPAINYRDHRKIVCVDGKIGYTGGANIADEYINKISPFGYWKDTMIRINGEAAETFSAMFIQMWNMGGNTLEYKNFINKNSNSSHKFNGITFPFGDYPQCSVGFSEKAFLNMINNANKQIDITTPYLVPDSRLVSAICLASENGVKVRLFTPSIPDKKYIHIVTRANYIPLLKSNVEIYEYTDGFIHAKSIICDNEIAYIGSCNLDYRSLYIHFESGVLTYQTNAVKQLSKDIEVILSHSKKISLYDKKIIKADKNILYKILRLFSGLL